MREPLGCGPFRALYRAVPWRWMYLLCPGGAERSTGRVPKLAGDNGGANSVNSRAWRLWIEFRHPHMRRCIQIVDKDEGAPFIAGHKAGSLSNPYEKTRSSMSIETLPDTLLVASSTSTRRILPFSERYPIIRNIESFPSVFYTCRDALDARYFTHYCFNSSNFSKWLLQYTICIDHLLFSF